MNESLLPVARDTFVSLHISFPHEEDFVRATGLQKSACANDTMNCTKAQYQYHMEKMVETCLHIYGKLVILKDENRVFWMKGIYLIWSRGQLISPSLPDRGPTGIWNLAHSISDPRAEISGILVMVRRSNSTFRGSTYWFWLLLYFWVLGIWFALAQIFSSEVLTVIKKKCTQRNGVREKLDPRIHADLNRTASWKQEYWLPF